MSKYPDCPETDKLVAIAKDSQKIGSFLEWLQENDFVIAYYGRNDILYQHRQTTNDLLAEYFKIDLDKVETERRAILNHLQEKV